MTFYLFSLFLMLIRFPFKLTVGLIDISTAPTSSSLLTSFPPSRKSFERQENDELDEANTFSEMGFDNA